MLVLLAAHAGLRAQEYSDLRWADVRLARRDLVVQHGKGGKQRVVALSATLRQALHALERRPDGYVLPYRTAGSAWRPCYTPLMTIAFSGMLWFWRGPAPWYFVTIPVEECQELQAIARFVTYGWGVIPVTAHIGTSTWQTSLFPKEGRYLVPIKARVREAEQLEEGDEVRVRLDVRVGRDHGRADEAP